MSQNFTRNDLAIELNLRLGMPVDRARGIVDVTLSVLTDALASGNNVEFRGFGMFDVVDRKAKVGRNPKHPEKGNVSIPARKAVRFRAGKELNNQLNPE
jgi:DNA-binding protein HU-beta/integration host factor subunit alpha